MVSDRRLLIRTPLVNVTTRSIYNAVRHLARDFNEIDLLLNGTNGPGDFAQRCYDRVQDILITELQAARPRFGLKVVDEADTIGSDDEQFWVIAPISGGQNFNHAHPHIALSAGVELKGEILASAVYDPLNDEMFYAERRQGVYVNERQIRPRKAPQTNRPLVMFAGNPETDHEDLAKLSQVADIRITGCPALDLCYAASGRADAVYVGNVSSCETAAGHFILQQANATFASKDEMTSYTHTGYLASTSSNIKILAKALDFTHSGTGSGIMSGTAPSSGSVSQTPQPSKAPE